MIEAILTLGAIIAIALFYFLGVRYGTSKTKERQEQETLDSIKKSQSIINDTLNASDDKLNELRNKWKL